MRNVVSSHEASQQMCDGSGLTTVRPEQECIHSSLSREQKISKNSQCECLERRRFDR